MQPGTGATPDASIPAVFVVGEWRDRRMHPETSCALRSDAILERSVGPWCCRVRACAFRIAALPSGMRVVCVRVSFSSIVYNTQGTPVSGAGTAPRARRSPAPRRGAHASDREHNSIIDIGFLFLRMDLIVEGEYRLGLLLGRTSPAHRFLDGAKGLTQNTFGVHVHACTPVRSPSDQHVARDPPERSCVTAGASPLCQDVAGRQHETAPTPRPCVHT